MTGTESSEDDIMMSKVLGLILTAILTVSSVSAANFHVHNFSNTSIKSVQVGYRGIYDSDIAPNLIEPGQYDNFILNYVNGYLDFKIKTTDGRQCEILGKYIQDRGYDFNYYGSWCEMKAYD